MAVSVDFRDQRAPAVGEHFLSPQDIRVPTTGKLNKILASGGTNSKRNLLLPPNKEMPPVRRSFQVKSTRMDTSPYTSGTNQVRDSFAETQFNISRPAETAQAANNSRKFLN